VDPYRLAEAADAVEAPTREGPLRLEVAPRHVVLALGGRRTTVSRQFVVDVDTRRRRARQRSRPRAGLVVVARDVPHEDLGVWMETAPDRVERIFGAEPADLIAPDGLANLRSLDRLAGRLRGALAGYAPGVVRAYELGRGLDKVLLLDRGDHLVTYVRPLFRGEARRVLDVHRDGRIVVAGDPPAVVRCRSRFGVTVLGDYVRFADPSGVDLARVAVRWIAREDRDELVRRFGDMVDPPDRGV